MAKLIVVFAWFCALIVSLVAEGLLAGTLLGLPGFSIDWHRFGGAPLIPIIGRPGEKFPKFVHFQPSHISIL
ncbi:MAG: hypothetical protein PHU25_01580 [Deltaproteobacteria bacterium]|nr:hypothetical protein [Deltaproteobacteria bacterium]